MLRDYISWDLLVTFLPNGLAIKFLSELEIVLTKNQLNYDLIQILSKLLFL